MQALRQSILRYSGVADATKEEKIANGEAVYVPRDESFEPIKQTNFAANSLRGLVHKVVPSIRDYFDATPGEFDSLRDMEQLYQEGLEVDMSDDSVPDFVKGLGSGRKETPDQTLERNRFLDGLPIPDAYRELVRSTTTPTSLLQYPLPRILSKDRFAWMRDDEFARQALAGVNPLLISSVEVRCC
jgi:lipoxygenase